MFCLFDTIFTPSGKGGKGVPFPVYSPAPGVGICRYSGGGLGPWSDTTRSIFAQISPQGGSGMETENILTWVFEKFKTLALNDVSRTVNFLLQ